MKSSEVRQLDGSDVYNYVEIDYCWNLEYVDLDERLSKIR